MAEKKNSTKKTTKAAKKTAPKTKKTTKAVKKTTKKVEPKITPEVKEDTKVQEVVPTPEVNTADVVNDVFNERKGESKIDPSLLLKKEEVVEPVVAAQPTAQQVADAAEAEQSTLTPKPALSPQAKQKRAKYMIGAGVIGLIAGVGISMVAFNQQAALTVNGKNFSYKNILDTVGKNNPQMASAYRPTVIYEALATKYKTSDIQKKADDKLKEVKSQYKGKQWEGYLAQNGFSNDADAKKGILTSLMFDEYVNSKITDKEVEKTYKNWIPNTEFQAFRAANKEQAEKVIQEFSDADGSFEDKIDAVSLDANKIYLNSLQPNMSTKEFTALVKGGQGTAKIIEGSTDPRSGQKSYAVLILAKDGAKKGTLEAEKTSIKTAIRSSLTANSKKFGEQFVKDFNIKGDSDFAKDLIKLLEAKN